MAEVSMPRLSDTMEEGTIASWLKKPGEQIKKGEVIAQIETDKATMDLTAFEAGTLEEILAPEGTTVAIGQPVARIGNGKASPAATTAPAATPEPPTTAAKPGPADDSAQADSAQADSAQADSAQAAASQGAAAAASQGAADTRGHGAPPAAGPSATPATGEGATPAASERGATAESAAQRTAPDASGAATGPNVAATREDGGGNAANGKVRASPMARHLASEHGLDLSKVSGSGPGGRVIRVDIEAALSSGQSARPTGQADAGQAPATDGEGAASPGPHDALSPEAHGALSAEAHDGPGSEADGSPAAGADDERVALSQMRRTIARRMAESTSTVPHFFLTTTVDVTELVKLRKQIVEQAADAGIKVTFNDLILKGAALALRKIPDVNVSFDKDSLIRHAHVHIGVAVATDRGLIVPVLRDADQKSLGEINRQTTDLAERARQGKLQPPDYSGGTFTISNLGMFGVEQFNAVINTPEAAILAVGAIAREPAEHDGQIVLRERMKLTLSVDHRALDGATGARYLQALKQLLEKPMLLLV
jgi:pyruvate dehydrogenase E2 component (dihydrolipoamide acetyltransferase)